MRLAEIKGPAFLLYWSWDFAGGWLELLNPLTWIGDLAHGCAGTGSVDAIRWERIGRSVGGRARSPR